MTLNPVNAVEASGKASALSTEDLLACLAHELRNPLSIVAFYVRQLEGAFEDGDTDRESCRRMLRRIRESSQRMEGIIAGVHQLDQGGGPDQFAVVDLNEVAREASGNCQELARQREVALELQLEREPLWVRCLPAQIGQAIINVVTNGIEAAGLREPRWVSVVVRGATSEALVEVVDGGPGISEKVARMHLFQPYYTTKKNGSGSGIGLSLCRRILETHRGRIELATCHPNTRFVIGLARALAPNAVPE